MNQNILNIEHHLFKNVSSFLGGDERKWFITILLVFSFSFNNFSLL